MALNVRKGVLTGTSGSSGNETITLPAGFAPKAIKAWCSHSTNAYANEDAIFCRGVGTYRGSTVQQVWSSMFADNLVATSAVVRGHGEDALLKAVEADGTTVAFELDLVSMSDTSVVVNWTDAPGEDVHVHYVIIGGSDVTDAYAGSFVISTATASQDVTAELPSGFGVPDILHSQSHIWTDTSMQGGAIRVYEAWDDGTDRWAMVLGQNDAVASPTQMAAKNHTALFGTTDVISTDDMVYTFDKVNSPSDGFQLDFSDQASFAINVGYLAFRMGANARWKIGGSSTLTGGSTQDLSLADGTASGAILAGLGIPDTSGAYDTTHAALGGVWLGGTDGTNEGSAGVAIPDAWEPIGWEWSDTGKALKSMLPIKAPWLFAQGTDNSVTTGTLTVTLPTHAADDILILVANFVGTSQTTDPADVPTPSGWSLIATQPSAWDDPSDDGGVHAFFWKRAASAAETNPTISRGSGWDTGTDTSFYGRAFTIRGCVTSGDPWDDAVVSSAYTSANGAFPAVTVSGDNRTVIVFANGGADAILGAAPTGWTAGTLDERTTGIDGSSQTYRKITSSSTSADTSNTSDPANLQTYAFCGISFKPVTATAEVAAADASLNSSSVRLTYSTLDSTARWFGWIVWGSAEATGDTIGPSAIASGERIGSHTVSPGNIDIIPSAISVADVFGTATINRAIDPSAIASLESFGVPLLDRGIVPTAIPSGEVFGSATLLSAATILANAIASAEALGLPSVGQLVVIAAIASDERHGTHLLDRGIFPTAIPGAEVFGTHLIDRGIFPGSVTSLEAFGLPVLTVTTDVLVSAIPSAEAIGLHTLLASATILLSAIASGEAFGAAVIGRIIDVSGIASAEAHGSHVLGYGLTPTSILSGESFGAHTLTSSATIIPVGILTSEAHGAHSIIVAGVVVIPNAIPTSEAIGAHTLSTAASILPGGVPTAEAIGLHTLGIGISPASVGGAEAFGLPLIDRGIFPASILGAEAFGLPVLTANATIIPVAIVSAESFGAHTVTGVGPGLTVLPASLMSAETFGLHTLVPGGVDIFPLSVSTGETFGLHSLTTNATIIPVALVSGEAFGLPELVTTGPSLGILPTGVLSAEAFGAHTLVPGGVTILPGSIGTAQALGLAALLANATITPGGVLGAESFGLASLLTAAQIDPAAISSRETIGAHVVSAASTVVVLSIGSLETFGTHVLGRSIDPSGIASGELLGVPSLSTPATIIVVGIGSQQVFGSHAVKAGEFPGVVFAAIVRGPRGFGSVRARGRASGSSRSR